MKNYKVVSDTGVSLDGELDVVHAKDTVFEADPEKVGNIAAMLETGAIVEVPAAPAVGGSPLPPSTPATPSATPGVIDPPTPPAPPTAPQAPANPPTVPATPAAPAPTGGTIDGSKEPRKRYRGKIVVKEEPRTVEKRTFQHVYLEDGQELDLTEVEYRTEVHISYPPNA